MISLKIPYYNTINILPIIIYAVTTHFLEYSLFNRFFIIYKKEATDNRWLAILIQS